VKLLFCIKSMNEPGGGAERVLATVTFELAERGHDISLLTFDRPGGHSFYALNDRIRRIELGLGSTKRHATSAETARRLWALRRAVLAVKPDLVVGFMHSLFIPLGLSLLTTQIPVLASEHIVYTHYRHRTLQRLLLELVPYLTTKMTCVSEQVRQSYPPRLQRHLVVIPNPVICSDEQMGKKEDATERKILLTIGRLAEQKGHATLIEAFAQISDCVPDWDLRIVGEGELREKLQSQVSALDLEQRVMLLGHTKHVEREYAQAQLFVIPSHYESFSLVTAEAIASGLPAVGFADCLGVNKLIVHDHNGLLACPGSKRSTPLAHTLKAVMSNADLRGRLAQNCGQVPREYDLRTVVDRWEEVIALAFDKTQAPRP
jgi:glycosyltransferase involved in cell wall biosynthesis